MNRLRDVERFWDWQPCHIRHSQAKVGTRKYFDEVEQRKYFVEPHIPGFADFARWKGKSVLEIGCGIGTDTINFARVGAHVTAVELSERSLDVAECRAQVFGLLGRIRFVLGNCERLSEDLPAKPYDLVYSFGVLHHTPSPGRALREIRKYMDARSELRIMMYSKVSIKTLQLWLGKVTCEAQAGVPVAYTYTRRELQRLLSGFDILRQTKAHIFSWRIHDYVQYRYRKAWPWCVMPGPMFKVLERVLGWHWLVTARLKG